MVARGGSEPPTRGWPCRGIFSVRVDAAELGEHVGVVGLEPVAEAAADQLCVSCPRCAEQNDVLTVEEIGRIIRVAGHALESLEGREGASRPLPPVAHQLQNTALARPGGVRTHCRRCPGVEVESAPLGTGWGSSPGEGAYRWGIGAIGGPVKL